MTASDVFLIRHYQGNDFNALAAIYDQGKADELTFASVTMDVLPMAQSTDCLTTLKRSKVWVCTQRLTGKIIGFTTLNGNTIGWLYVAKAYRKQGVASQLLHHLAQNNRQLELYTLKANVPAVNLYLKFGFHVIDSFTDPNFNEPVWVYRMHWESPSNID